MLRSRGSTKNNPGAGTISTQPDYQYCFDGGLYSHGKIAVYCAVKAVVVMFSKVLAKELAQKKIRVNVLSPCGTKAEMMQDMARMVTLLTNLPATLDMGEVTTHKRLMPD